MIPNNLIIDNVQISLFPNDFEIFNTSDTFEQISKGFKNKGKEIDIEKSIVDTLLPPTAPREIQRMQVKLKNKNIEIILSPIKISFIWKNQESNEAYSVKFDEIKDIINVSAEVLKLNIFNRVGHISTILYNDVDPVNAIKRLFNENSKMGLRDALINLTYDFPELKKELVETIEYNKVVQISSSVKRIMDNQKVLFIQQDINTRQGQSLNWNVEKVLKFIKAAANYNDKEKLYGGIFD